MGVYEFGGEDFKGGLVYVKENYFFRVKKYMDSFIFYDFIALWEIISLVLGYFKKYKVARIYGFWQIKVKSW